MQRILFGHFDRCIGTGMAEAMAKQPEQSNWPSAHTVSIAQSVRWSLYFLWRWQGTESQWNIFCRNLLSSCHIEPQPIFQWGDGGSDPPLIAAFLPFKQRNNLCKVSYIEIKNECKNVIKKVGNKRCLYTLKRNVGTRRRARGRWCGIGHGLGVVQNIITARHSTAQCTLALDKYLPNIFRSFRISEIIIILFFLFFSTPPPSP